MLEGGAGARVENTGKVDVGKREVDEGHVEGGDWYMNV